MKHSIVYKDKDRYSSFPLLEKLNDRILIGFFTAPVPDHMGLFWWNVLESFDQGETWQDFNRWIYGRIGMDSNKLSPILSHPYNWSANSPREKSDRFTFEIDNSKFVTGSYGFKVNRGKAISRSTSLFYQRRPEGWKIDYQKIYEIPGIDIILTFPRALHYDNLILIPAYAILKGTGKSRCFVWRSEDRGKNFHLWNMFPNEIDGNEMAFIVADNQILAHIRSDKHPYLMESWSEDFGKTWSYPMKVRSAEHKISSPVIGGPPHLLRLKDNRILCSYGYRFQPMGIHAIVSEDEGQTWTGPMILREGIGYSSSLHKRRWRNRFKLPSAANDMGYPVSIQLDDESILTAYYITNSDKITHIASTRIFKNKAWLAQCG